MLSIILIAFVLVAVHAAGLAVPLRGFTTRWQSLPSTRFWPITRRLIHMTWWLILIQLSEIAVWGLFYLWWGCLPNTEAAFYFAGVTYTSIGYAELGGFCAPHLHRDTSLRGRQRPDHAADAFHAGKSHANPAAATSSRIAQAVGAFRSHDRGALSLC